MSTVLPQPQTCTHYGCCNTHNLQGHTVVTVLAITVQESSLHDGQELTYSKHYSPQGHPSAAQHHLLIDGVLLHWKTLMMSLTMPLMKKALGIVPKH